MRIPPLLVRTGRAAMRALLFATLPVACAGSPPDPFSGDESLRAGPAQVLFVGNSLTYTNNLPAMMVRIARAAGDTGIGASSVAFPNFALEDHLAEGSAVRALQRQRWTWVVMQQGPSSLPQNQLLLRDGAQAFDRHVRAAGAEPVLFMVWPTVDRPQDFPAVRTSYRNAAAAVDGVLAPAGDAWVVAAELDPSIALYSPDGLHPSTAGSYLSAIVILAAIRGVDPQSLPRTVPGIDVPEPVVVTLQRAARLALDRNPVRP